MSHSVNRILPLLFSAGRVFHEQSSEAGRPDVVSMLHLHTVQYVSTAGQPLMKDVARYLSVTPSSATTLITSLVNARLLARRYDERDRRLVRLIVTPKGRLFLRHGMAEKRRRIRNVLARLNQQEQRQLVKILRKLTRLKH